MSQNVRTRFAPSPTGHLHIGNARTAIMNWLFSKHSGGQFILRIEDTDQERSTPESEKAILDDLLWLGLSWDEGPETGGEYGPYRQSKRLEFYKQHAQKLLDDGKAYPCYCSADELEARRKDQVEKGQSTGYDGRCYQLTDTEKQKLESEGRKPVLRFHVSKNDVTFQDMVKGSITIPGDHLSDYVITRADGMPMYNFSCVVDDHLMAITHVIRGDDHVSNTPRQILLYNAFDWQLPQFAHIPMILGQDRNRLSKRHGATSVAQYREAGYLPETLLNFLSLLSWSSESGDEILSIERLIKEFDFSRVSKSSAVFDTDKLNWMNGMYIRQMESSKFFKDGLLFLKNSGFSDYKLLNKDIFSDLFQEKVETLSELPEKAVILFQESVVPENDEANELIQTDDSQKVFKAFLFHTECMKSWDGETFMQVMKAIQKETEVKGKSLWMPIRIALTGQMHGPDLSKLVTFFGLEKCRKLVQEVVL